MPLTRYQIRNEYGLADPEVYKAADRDDPEAILEGVAMAGLVGVLRQLGDLAEFAAEIFHHLHEEVMATAARGHGLMARVQQLESEVPLIEKVFLSQTNHTPFFSNPGVDWHPNLNSEQNLITSGDLPRFVMDSYEECRGPPRLFLLDKFDVAGAGACLKRYTDPSFFKVETASVEFQRERRSRKVKKKGPRERHGGTPQIPTSHAKLHQLLLEERVENGNSDPARLMKLKRRQLNGSPFDLKPAKSYMEKFLETPSPEPKLVHEVPFTPSSSKFIEDSYKESEPYMVDIDTVSPVKEPFLGKEITCSSPNAHAIVPIWPTGRIADENIDKGIVRTTNVTVGHESPSVIDDTALEEVLDLDQDDKTDGSLNVDDRVSEVDNYMDALTVMESEMETDNEYKPKNYRGSLDVRRFLDNDGNGNELDIHANLSDSLSTGNYSQSEDGTNLSKKGRSVSSYSNSFGDLTENFTPDEEGKPQLFRSGEDSVVHNADFHSDNETVSTLGSIPHEDGLLSDYSKNFNPPDPGEASCSSSITDSRDIPQSLLSMPAGSVERLPPEEAKLQSRLPNEDNGASLPEPSVVTVDIPSQIFTSRISSQSHHICESDHEEEKLTSAAFVQTSKDMLEPSHERRDSDDFVDDVLQTKYEVEVSSDNVGKEGTFSSCSVILTGEQQNSCSTLPESDVGSGITRSLGNMNILNSDDLVSVVDDCSSSKKDGLPTSSSISKADDIVTEADHSFETDGTIEQERNQPVLQVEVDLAVVVPSSKGKIELEEVSDAAVLEENNKITGNSDMAAEGDTTSPHSSQYLDKDILDQQLQEVGSVTRDIDENVVVSSAAAASDIKESGFVDALSADAVSGDVGSLDNSSVRNLMKLQESSSVSEGAALKEFDPKVSLESFAESQAQRELKQPEAPSTEHDPAFSILFSNDSSKTVLEVKEQIDSPTGIEVFDNPGHDEVTEECNSKPSYEEMKSKSSGEIPWFSRTRYTSGEAFSSDQLVLLQSDKIDSSSFCGSEVNVESLSFSATPTCTGNSVESSHKVQSDTLSGEYLQSYEAKMSSNLTVGESEQLYTPSKAGQERCDNVPVKSEELLSQSDSLPNNGDMLLTNPFVSYPGFAVLPEATKTSSENVPPLSRSTEPVGVPPMPPLPPIQWRRGKEVQHATLPEQNEWIVWNTFPHLQSSTSEEKGTFGFASLGTEIAPPKPFLFSNAVDSLRLGALSAEPMEMSNSLSLEKPAGVDDMNRLNNVHMEVKAYANPFLTSETMPGDGPRQDLFTSMKEPMQSDANQLPEPTQSDANLLPEPTQSDANLLPLTSTLEHKTCNDELKGSMSLPSSHLDAKAPETAVEIKMEKKAAEDSLQNLEEEQRPSADKPSAQPGLSEKQVEHDLSTSNAEAVGPPSTLGLPMTYEVGKINGNKIPRPRNPLFDAVALDKSKLRKASERVRPQIEPKADERDSILEQIRTRSFSLKPTAVTRARPIIQSIQGPKTNLKVAAILEKANTIRQAMAGSDEDNDSDSWSDS